MDIYLQGADIHDFLSSLGRHTITTATFGFHDLKYNEPKSSNLVFVEDTGELAQGGEGFGVPHKKETEATPGGWGGDGMQKEDTSGWGMEPNNKEASEPSHTGWGMESNTKEGDEQMPSNNGWGMEIDNEEKKETMASSAGWAACDNSSPKQGGWAVPNVPSPKQGGWGDEQDIGNDGDGWNAVEADKKVSPSEEGEWGSEQAVADDGWDSMTKLKVDNTDHNNSNSMEGQTLTNDTSKGGLMHPTRKSKDDSTYGCADERRSGMFGPSGSNMVPLGKKRKFGTKSGLSHNAQESTMLNNTQLSQDKEEQMGWGGCKETATLDGIGGWDNNSQEEKAIVDGFGGWGNNSQEEKGVVEEEMGRDERVSGAEWGNVSASDVANESLKNEGDTNSAWNSPPEGEVLAGWGADVKDQGKDVEWAQEAGWGHMPACQPEQEETNESIKNGDWSSQPDSEIKSSQARCWGSQMANKGGAHGWDDMKSEAPPARPASNKERKSFQTSWNSGPTMQFNQDGTPPPRKRFNRGSTEGSWAGFVSNSPQSQSRRPRLRALLNLPEYSELDELYRATNKILHHSDYQPGDKLKPEDEKYLLENILVHHPDREAKLGCGVDYVMIDSHAEHQVSCFWVVRKDASKTDFSYWKCLEGLLGSKYPYAAKDLVKEGGKTGVHSMAPTKIVCDQDKALDGWTSWGSSKAPITSMRDQEEAKDSWTTGVTPIAPDKSVSHQDIWDTGAAFVSPTKTTCGDLEGAKADAPDDIQGEAKGGWDMGAASLGPITNVCNQEEAQNSCWENPTTDVCKQEEAQKSCWENPTTNVCKQEETKNSGWDMGATSLDPKTNVCNQEEAQNSCWENPTNVCKQEEAQNSCWENPTTNVCKQEEAKNSSWEIPTTTVYNQEEAKNSGWEM